MKKDVLIDFNLLDKSSETLKVLAHPMRLAILELLLKNEKLSVSDIYEHLNIEQSVASYHLKNMRMVNLVNTNRKGTKIFYTITNAEVQNVFNSIIKLCKQ